LSEPLGPGRVLFVCTANICRSPTAELLARTRFGERDFAFRSAGFLAADHRCPDELVQVLADRHIDASAHRSYQIDAPSLSAADLVLTMESSHVQKATSMMPEAFPKILPLKEAVAIAGSLGAESTIASLLAAANRDRDPRSYLGSKWDVDDPYGRRIKAYRDAVSEIEDLVGQLLTRLRPTSG
jgi:protein-tyrosine-phosphatase